MSPRPRNRPPLALAYVRVSTDGQYASGAGLAAQTTAVRSEAERRGWDLLEVVGEDDGSSSATLDRPGLQGAMARLDAGEADVLIVAKMDRLSRSVLHGAQVMERAQRRGWSLVVVDMGIDMTTPSGEMMAKMLLVTAEFERNMIRARTRDALAAKRAAGVRLGRPQSLPLDTVARIVRAHRAGQSMNSIATALNADGVPTAHGGAAWRHSTVKRVLDSQAAASVPQE